MANWLARAHTVYEPEVRIEPRVDSVRRIATPSEAAELRELVSLVAADWPEAERAEALAAALADPEEALACWRALAA